MLSRIMGLRPGGISWRVSKNNGLIDFKLLNSLIHTPRVHKATKTSSQKLVSLAKSNAVLNNPQIIQSDKRKYKEGEKYFNFECVRTELVPEFSITSYTFRHLGTGTELWYLDRNDPNNVFSINFRTTPFDSTGLPHILEHSVLCGSKNYPIRDPFFKMLNRSVATFMNAMTGPDYTVYPFSTMNEVDYRNLQKIYLDAVFRPNLEYLDFLQEGWRLQHTDLHDKNSEYIFKGVVYNEMKGAFSENASLFGQNLLNNMLPNHTYGFVSGGNPLEIPKLSHMNLVEFHRKYYHPSNAKIYAYGSFDLNKTLEYIDEEFLSKYERIDNSYSRIPSQIRWEKPRYVHISSRFDNMGAPFEKQNQMAIGLLMTDITNIKETFLLYVLSELLVRGPNSPFYKSVIEPNFSGGYNQNTGFDPQVKDTFFCVGLQDLCVDAFDNFIKIFDTTIQQVLENGFESQHIESVLHNIELSLKHQSPQFGLGLLLNSTPLWNHEGDVVKNLHLSHMIAEFREELKRDPKYLQKKILQYFFDNQHRLTMTMSPDDHYEENFKTAEYDLLKQKIFSLCPEKRQQIYDDGLRLEEAQKAIPNLDVLPCLSVDDVKEAAKVEPINIIKVKNVPTQVCNVHTNEISYIKVYFDGSTLTREDIMLIPLFCNVIHDMGTANYDYRQFDKLVHSKTGGIDFKLHFAENIYDSKTFDLGVLMTTHALDKNTDKMFEFIKELITKFKLDDLQRMDMLINNYVSSLSVGIANAGHLYAMQSCAGLVTDSAKLKSELAGIEHIAIMKNYVKKTKIQDILEQLKVLGGKLFDKGDMRVAVNTSEEFHPTFMNHYENFLEDLPDSRSGSKNVNQVNMLEPSNQHFVMNIPVNYCAKAFFAVPYTHRDHPTLRVLAKLISAKYLLPIVRDQSGAYGAGAKISSDGIFSFFSYRDPNSIKTLEAFDNTYKWLTSNKTKEQALFEAKLGVLQQLDAPVAPGNIGIDYFLYGVTQEMFLKYRTRVLSVTLSELNSVIEKYFKTASAHRGKCVLGPENAGLKKRQGEKWKSIV